MDLYWISHHIIFVNSQALLQIKLYIEYVCQTNGSVLDQHCHCNGSAMARSWIWHGSVMAHFSKSNFLAEK